MQGVVHMENLKEWKLWMRIFTTTDLHIKGTSSLNVEVSSSKYTHP